MMLSQLPLNRVYKISQLPKETHLCIALLEQGFFVGADIYIAHKSPFKGPIAIGLLGSTLCIQHSLASKIRVEPL
jgi:Fe2+ transport system protein FeoA